MYILSEDEVQRALDCRSAMEAVQDAFVDLASGRTENFPVVRQLLRGSRDLCGVKSGCNYRARQLGLKAGGYWSDNPQRDLDRHQSTVLLLDLDTGRPRALIAGNALTAIRTAAASAAAVRFLARADAERLAMIGTGRQALFQLDAIMAVRPIRSVAAWSPTPANVTRFGTEAERRGIAFRAAANAADAARDADVIVTVTPSREPLLQLQDIAPGVHISAMGSDTAGKQELDTAILDAARIFVDDPEQAATIGECQHLKGRGDEARPWTLLGDVIRGHAEGRRALEELTIFDGTGIALQDLAVGWLAINRARDSGTVRTVQL